ncbi:MAG: diguanylate cyclase [Butyrivibrio sp.]|nr:diguanylate cyclase [Butyrivibrio sp.]
MAKHKIMIVDDEKISLRMSEHILSSEYDTVCASDGKTAIELYKTELPDLILSDLRMPEIDGFTLQKTLQEQEGHQIPFMFMTADKNDETESKGFAIGALDFIRKPFRADVLLKRVSNILKNVEQIQGLKKAAVTDPMTGLLNKASSQKEIDILVKSNAGALMMIDLDNFKPVNDIYGHDMGDKVLIKFAEIIRSAIRSTDLAGRMGGDEFIVFCKNILDESVVAEKAHYINDQLVRVAKALMGDDMSIPIGVSMGCAFAPDEGKDFQTLFKKADKALYEVKQNGKHGYNVFRSESKNYDDTMISLNALSTSMMLMEERSPARGAMLLPQENFKSIYQFLNRVVQNYHKSIHLMLYSVVPVESDVDPEKAMDELTNVVKNSLRQSDVITKLSKNQLMVILLKALPSDIEIVTERINMNWDASDLSDLCKIAYEVDVLH